MPINRVIRPKSPDLIAQQGLYGVNIILRRRLAALQAHVDAEGERWANGAATSIYSAQTAVAAVSQYDRTWFRQKLWSRNVKSHVARALIDACQPYPTIDTSFWQSIVRRAS